MIKYSYIYNIDGTDYLNPNVYEKTESQAEDVANATSVKNDELEFGTPIVIIDPSRFRLKILSAPNHINMQGRDVKLKCIYIGYYYDSRIDAYTIDANAIDITAEHAYDTVANDMIQMQLLDPEEITNEFIDGQYQDTENVVCNHEGGMIEVSMQTLQQLKLRLKEVDDRQ